MNKKLATAVLAAMPFMAFAESAYTFNLEPDQPVTQTITVKGYNDRIPSVDLELTAQFSKTDRVMTFKVSAPKPEAPAGKGKKGQPAKAAAGANEFVWFPQNKIKIEDFKDYFKKRGGAFKSTATFNEQISFLNLYDSSVETFADARGCNYDGCELTSPMKLSKPIDRQILPLDGKSEMEMTFKLEEGAKKVYVILKNPMPMIKGKVLNYIGSDIEIEINLTIDTCKENEQLLVIAKEYLAVFAAGEAKMEELQRSGRALLAKCKELLVEQFSKIDARRFDNSGCEELQYAYDDLMSCMDRLKAYDTSAGTAAAEAPAPCDPAALNSEIRAATSRLNGLANDWISARDEATKASQKAAFDSLVSATDATIRGLSQSCASRLDSKILNNYETAKKLIK